MNGDLPPNSKDNRLPDQRHLADVASDVGEPVNAILSTSGWLTSALRFRQSPVTTLSTPAGSPCLRNLAKQQRGQRR